MKCDIIKDLLPVYIDGLTSETSNTEIKEHLACCEDCNAFYNEMKGDFKAEIPVVTVKEIDFLKKIKRKNVKTALLWVGVTVVVLLALAKLFALGFAVKSDEIKMTHTFENGNLQIELNLSNGHDLIVWSESNPIYDENGECIGFDHINKPRWVFHNPFDDVGTSFSSGSSFGGSLDKDSKYTFRDIIRFKDKDIVFINGELVR